MNRATTVRRRKAGATPPRRAARERSVRPGDADFYRGDAYPICESVGYLVKQIRSQLERAVDAEMARHDLTGVQWGPLLMIDHGLGHTAAEIARVAGVDTGAVTRMLDRLEGKGLIRRIPSPDDRRVVRLTLTRAGERLCAEIPFGLARVSNALLRGFTPAEFETLKDFLGRMLANLQDAQQ
ncbi:MAG: MarR family transcriptional regulator [Burkholderiales bacterium]|nr:MarR family transcriptional regulator [Burkholderiales bacterium]